MMGVRGCEGVRGCMKMCTSGGAERATSITKSMYINICRVTYVLAYKPLRI